MRTIQPHSIYRIGQLTLAILFIGSGLIPLFLSDPVARLALLNPFPIPTAWHGPLFYGLVAMDVIFGVLCLLFPSRIIWLCLLLIVLGYTITMTIFMPEIWRDPFGTMFKNIPILSLLWITYSLEEK